MGDWIGVTLGDVMTLVRDQVAIEPLRDYATMGIRYGIGAYARDVGRVRAARMFRARAGQFMFSRIDTQRGAFAVVPTHLDGCLVTNEFPTYEPSDGRVLLDFLLLYFRQQSVLDAIGRSRSGTEGRSRWKEADFEAWSIALPPLDEQRRIVSVIAALDAQIEALETESARFSDLRAALIRSDLDRASDVCTIGDYAEVSQGRSLPKAVQDQISGDVSWFKIADMAKAPNVFGYEVAATRLSAAEIAQLGGRIVRQNTVVFPRVGAAVLTEKKRILDVDGAVDENHLVLAPTGSTDPEFLLGLMEAFRLSSLTQTGAVPSLNMGIVRAAVVPRVQQGDQQRLGTSLRHMRILGRAFSAELAALRVVRADLLTALLAQKITVDDAVDQFVEVAA